MVGVKKIGIFLSLVILGLVAFNSANAVDLSITVNTINGTALPGETLEYNITFYNLESNSVSLSTNIFFGSPEFSPSNVLVIPGKSTQTLNLKIGIDQSDADDYGSLTGQTTYQKLLIFDEDGEQLGYNVLLPAKIINTRAASTWGAVGFSNVYTTPANIDPQKPFSITATINNPIETRSVETAVQSNDFVIIPGVKVIPNGTNEVVFDNLQIPINTSAGQYDVSLKLIFPDDTTSIPLTLDVGSFANCVVAKEVQSGILGKTYTATVSVEGNEQRTCTVSEELSGLERMLVTQATEGFSYFDTLIQWQVNVQPGTESTVSYKVSYLPIIAVPFIIILAAILFWFITRKVEIIKELVDYRRHPGFMDLKIQLKIKNRTTYDLENVKIIDPLPAFVKEVKEYGTVHGEVAKYKGKKSVKWELDYLKPKEERVFSYKIRTSVEVLGKMNFPPTVMTYIDDKGVKQEDTSNILSVEVE